MRLFVYIVTSTVIFFAGWISHKQLRGEDTTEYHWKKVTEWREFMSAPSNLRSSMGYNHISPEFDQTPYLEALVAAGELKKRWVVIPEVKVSKEANNSLIQIFDNPNVMDATQGEHYSGDLPLTFIVWYRPAFEKELENYINDLKG